MRKSIVGKDFKARGEYSHGLIAVKFELSTAQLTMLQMVAKQADEEIKTLVAKCAQPMQNVLLLNAFVTKLLAEADVKTGNVFAQLFEIEPDSDDDGPMRYTEPPKGGKNEDIFG